MALSPNQQGMGRSWDSLHLRALGMDCEKNEGTSHENLSPG